MNSYNCVASRTRSKDNLRVMEGRARVPDANMSEAESGSGTSSSMSTDAEPAVVFLGEYVASEPEVIEIDESDEEEDDTENDHDDMKEEVEGNDMFGEKVQDLRGDGCGNEPANPITIDLDGDTKSEEECESSSGFDYDIIWSSSDTEDEVPGDEDFKIDDEIESSGTGSEDGFTSYDDERDDERIYGKRKKKKSSGLHTMKFARFNNQRRMMKEVEGMKVESQSGGICRDYGETSTSFGRKYKLDECDEQYYGSVVYESEIKGCSTELYEEKRKKEAKQRTEKNVNAGVREKTEDSAKLKIVENKKERENKYGVNIVYHKKKDRVDSQTGDTHEKRRVRRMPSRSKEVHLIELLNECFLSKSDPIEDKSNGLEENDDYVQEQDTQPPACTEKLPLKIHFWRKKDEPVEKSESEKEEDRLWEELDMLLRLEQNNSPVGNAETNEAEQNRGNPAAHCNHEFFLDEQIGIYCKRCLWIHTGIKYVMPPFVDDIHLEISGKRVSSGGVNVSPFDGAQFDASDGGSEAGSSHNDGTVWDLIPDIKQSLYAHQREGFEFLWTNLAGTIDLHTLKNADPSSAGGCIISHAPGTGKTRLTMVFLQTYLEVFPKCLPVIIAPASLLLTWEDEFKKWDIGVPFHNLNNLELSGKEHVDAVHKVAWSNSPNQNKENIRMVKLYSWFKEKSILGISYNLYEKLAGEKCKVDLENGKKNKNRKKEKKYASMKENTERRVMGKILRGIPGLLVLDEGHTPRNQRSLIWKVLSEIQTQKRIILSGTPFQNNFVELYNTLCLVKPSFPDMIPQELKKFCQSRLMQEKKASEGVNWEPGSSGNTTGNPADENIHQLKLLMDPFVHVHKGSILQKNLPGLKNCVLTLIPDNMQKSLLESIDSSQNTLKFEHKLALVSVHPSLFLSCSPSEKEESFINRVQLEDLKLNPYVGVKTRFLVEFVRLCEVVKEKVLVFSQFIDPLCLIIDQLKSVFHWSEGKEVLYMCGKMDQRQKQSLIHCFNDANSKAKILLASTKACSEGINLIGASRVVLLDVVWNPSVERQAISRAYRLGQKRVVYTYHLITHGTSECTKYCKQAEKDRLSELVFSARNTEHDEPKSSSAYDDRVLDQMVQHPKLKDMFGECLVQPKERNLFESFGS